MSLLSTAAKRIAVQPKPQAPNLSDRRSATFSNRLRDGLLLLYRRATDAKDDTPFVRDMETWAALEHAALPEIASFSFVHKSRRTDITPSAVLAEAMIHIWTVAGTKKDFPPPHTTAKLITELAQYICAVYEMNPIQRRHRNRDSLGLDITG